MSPGPDDQVELEALVQRARTQLGGWVDRDAADPGVALVELLAFVADLLASASERAAAEAYLVSEGGRGRGTGVEFGDGVHGRRPPSGPLIAGRYRRGSGYASVHRQQGRVPLDTDVPRDPLPTVHGVHRGIVLDDVDPLGQQRVLVSVPDLGDDTPRWAAACLAAAPDPAAANPPGNSRSPAVGAGVWVAFEAGDRSYPVWLGWRT